MIHRALGFSCLIAAVSLSGWAGAETVSFQNGVNGYESTFDLQINDDVETLNELGADVQYYWIDSDQSNRMEVNFWGLIRFDNIFGLEAGQIPPGATVLSARLELTTSTVNNAQAGGPFGVARLLKPFDENSTWSSLFGDGAPCGGVPDETELDRAAGGYRSLTVGTTSSADVSPIVQAWSGGEPNHGFVVIAGTADGWSVQTTGATNAAVRPRLVVDYVDVPSRAVVFQEGVDNYGGTSMIFLRMDGVTDLGENHVTDYLDMRGAAPDTTNTVHALIKFDGIFGSDAGQVPVGAEILRAYVNVTTAARSESFETRSNGPYNIRRLLTEFNWTLTDGAPGLRYWSDFGPDGPTEASGTVGPVVANAVGMVWSSRAWFEITDVVKAWQTGEPNLGLILESASSDGWKINWLQAGAVPPQLVVLIAGYAPDLNGDTYVDQADIEAFVECISGPEIPIAPGCAKANFDNDHDVDQDDFGVLQECYSGSYVAPAECL